MKVIYEESEVWTSEKASKFLGRQVPSGEYKASFISFHSNAFWSSGLIKNEFDLKVLPNLIEIGSEPINIDGDVI